MTLALYYYPDNASLAPHLCLRRANAEFDLRLVDRKNDALKSDWYRRLNPHGRIPVLVDGDPDAGGLVLRESASICQYIAEKYPESALLPEEGKERARAIDWLTYLTNTIQPDLLVWAYTDRYAETEEQIAAVKRQTAGRLRKMFAFVEEELAQGGDWLTDTIAPSAADYFLFMLAGWGRQFRILEDLASYPHLVGFALRCQARSEVIACFTAEETSFHFVS